MDDAVDGVLLKDLLQRGLIRHIYLIAFHGFTGDLGNALCHYGTAVGVVIGDDHVITGVQELNCRMRTNVTGAAGEKNSHSHLSFLFLVSVRTP